MLTEVEIEATGDREKWESELNESGCSEAVVFSKANLTGAEPVIIAILKVAAAAIPAISAYLKSKRVNKLRVGDVVIENPTPEQIEQALKGGTVPAIEKKK